MESEAILLTDVIGPSGKLISVEAHPDTFSCLKKLVEINNLSNVVPLNLVIADKEGELFIEDDGSSIGRSIDTTTGSKIRSSIVDKISRHH